jgi:acyl carrier protein
MNWTSEQIVKEVLDLLQGVARDWDFDGPLTANTRLFADLAFESLELVILGAAVQQRFGQTFPFAEFFADMAKRDTKDLTVAEWAAFIERHLRPVAATARPAGSLERV